MCEPTMTAYLLPICLPPASLAFLLSLILPTAYLPSSLSLPGLWSWPLPQWRRPIHQCHPLVAASSERGDDDDDEHGDE